MSPPIVQKTPAWKAAGVAALGGTAVGDAGTHRGRGRGGERSREDPRPEPDRVPLGDLRPDLLGVGVQPAVAIGQRALLVQTPHGNVLWDCVSLLDDASSLPPGAKLTP